MTNSSLEIALLVVLLVVVMIDILINRQRKGADSLNLGQLAESWQKSQARLESSLREEIARNRGETAQQAQNSREELSRSFTGFTHGLQKQTMDAAILQKNYWDEFSRQLSILTESNEKRLDSLRDTVERSLTKIQEDNDKKLEQMRITVDEKLQGTLEKRLGDSFRLVSDRLEQVHQGLGDMRNLAVGVGDLKRVLTNVKSRGGWGEVQLGMLLEEILAPEQFGRNVQVRDKSQEMVEFAIKMPGQTGTGREGGIWLPIDAKFPLEDYERLMAAQESADGEAINKAGKMLEAAVKSCARDICTKYLNPPVTTDFAVMYLATEGLYAEVARRPALMETMRRDFRVIIAGPSTCAALLNSLQMGFCTLAIQKRSGEIWGLLGTIKSEFGKFGAVLEGVKKKLAQAQNSMEMASRRSRTIERRLRDVQELPGDATQQLFTDDQDEEVQD